VTHRLIVHLAVSLAVLSLGAEGTLAQTGSPAAIKKGTVEQITVHGKSLEGNLSGDSADRPVFVYLPPSYATAKNRRYPVAYLLHGYGLTGERWMSFTKMADAADKDIAAGTAKEVILVNPDAHTKWDGSMYSASPTSGDWETFIAEDLVKYIDSHYRTMATREARALGGHSMGGYGTIRIGMKRPDVYSSLYIMSACCLLNDPTPRGGGAGRGGQRGNAAAPAGQGARATPPAEGRAGAANGGRAGANGGRAGNAGRGGGGFANVQLAEAAAWSSNPNNPPDYVDLPVKDGELQPLIRDKWIANSPLVMLDQYITNLKKYSYIGLEVGTQDTLAASNRQLDQAMTTFGIKHTFETYEGDHTNRVPQRFEENVFAFLAKALPAPK
jgi:S-formylglutathione hydrolase FrmB